ncbi:hypothetical protein [Devosia sp. FKR38]|uniref:hypothetical protein n=1 Tax=Devosia sp. FKR38 TaxID=2562312 RepID=UPI0010C120EE|nr:hypothetical protein [Devosia sp. FKR38]
MAFEANARRAGNFAKSMRAQSGAASHPGRFQRQADFKETFIMPPTYLLARDHLERAAALLRGDDGRARQVLYIIERTINLMDDMLPEPRARKSNVLDFEAFRVSRAEMK